MLIFYELSISLFEAVSILANSSASTAVLFVETDNMNLAEHASGTASNLGNEILASVIYVGSM